MDAKMLKVLRVKAGLSQEELANEVGVSQSAVTNWEREISAPSNNKLPLLAKVLNCKIDDLFRKE